MLIGAALAACLAYPVEQTRKPVEQDVELLYAPHFADGEFFNPWNRFVPSRKSTLRFALTRNPYDKPREPGIPVIANDGAQLARFQHSPLLTWVGHATFIIQEGNDVVLTDPHFGSRFWTFKRKSPPGVPLAAVPQDAFAVISHSHYDHLDEFSIESLPASVQYFVPLGLADWFRARGRTDVVELDWWQSARRGTWTITCLPSQHWSRRFGMAFNATLWCSWLLDSGQHRYYFGGDTGYFHGFAEFGRRFGPIDAALLPIGAYQPRAFLRYQHMDPAEAYQAFRDLGARFLLPMHWGAFDLTHEPLGEPPVDLRRAIEAAGGDAAAVRILAVGESWRLPPEPAPER